MEPLCYLFSVNGWLTKTGQRSTDITDAATYGLPEARLLAKRHKNDSGHTVVPVRVTDIEE